MEHTYLELPEDLFETSALETFKGELPLPPISMGADLFTFITPVRYQLLINNTGGALLATGNAVATVRTACARCLDEVDLDLDVEIQSYFVLPGKDALVTEDEEIEYETLVNKNKIDLTDLCTAAFALDIPYIPLCKEDCAGLCSHCGTNLNHDSCECSVVEEPDTNNPFAVLKDFKFSSDRDG